MYSSESSNVKAFGVPIFPKSFVLRLPTRRFRFRGEAILGGITKWLDMGLMPEKGLGVPGRGNWGRGLPGLAGVTGVVGGEPS